MAVDSPNSLTATVSNVNGALAWVRWGKEGGDIFEDYNKKADTSRAGLLEWETNQDFPAGLTTASGCLPLGGLVAVGAGECAPAASSGLAASGGV